MSLYQLEPPEAPRERPPWLITGILLAIVLLLIAAGGLFWLGRYGIALAPTPTQTATPAPPPTATPDFRATNIAADLATQIAYEAVVTRQTPFSIHMPIMPAGDLDTPTPHSVNLPYITTGAVITPTAVVTSSVAPVVTPETQPATVEVNVPIVETGPQSPLETPSPTLEVILPTDTPTPTFTVITLPTATPIPTYTPMPSPTVVLVNSLKAVVKPTFAFVRGAPSNAVTPVATIVAGTGINLQRRDSTGEWVYFCCSNNELRWMRQVYAPPAANPTVTNLPPSATPDDVRWLATEPWPVNVPQTPTATPIPPDDFPHYRHDRANTARVPAAFSGSLVQFWPLPALAAQPFTSAVVVVRQNVVVASADNNLYSFDRNFSNQLWRYTVGQRVTQPLWVQENIIYLADDTGRMLALPDTGSAPIWQTSLSVPGGLGQAPPVTGFVGAGSRLFIAVNNGNNNYRVLQVDRGNGAVLQQFDVGNVPPQALTIGNQLLYVAGAQLWALDIENFEVVWARGELTGFTAAPVYAANGATALAELYAAGQGGRIYLLDANLGIDVRQYDGGNELVNGLALGDSNIYAYGNGFVKAYDRRSSTLIWRANIAGDVRSVFVTADQLLIVTGGGSIQFVTTTGSSLSIGPSVPASVSNSAAVSGRYLFVPGDDGHLYGFSQ